MTYIFWSQLDVRHLATGEVVFRGTVGGSVNNALHIAKDLSGKCIWQKFSIPVEITG